MIDYHHGVTERTELEHKLLGITTEGTEYTEVERGVFQ